MVIISFVECENFHVTFAWYDYYRIFVIHIGMVLRIYSCSEKPNQAMSRLVE